MSARCSARRRRTGFFCFFSDRNTRSIDRSIDQSERSIRCALCLKVPWQLEAAAESRASLWNKSSVIVGPDMQVGALLVPRADQSSRSTVRASTRFALDLCSAAISLHKEGLAIDNWACTNVSNFSEGLL